MITKCVKVSLSLLRMIVMTTLTKSQYHWSTNFPWFASPMMRNWCFLDIDHIAGIYFIQGTQICITQQWSPFSRDVSTVRETVKLNSIQEKKLGNIQIIIISIKFKLTKRIIHTHWFPSYSIPTHVPTRMWKSSFPIQCTIWNSKQSNTIHSQESKRERSHEINVLLILLLI